MQELEREECDTRVYGRLEKEASLLDDGSLSRRLPAEARRSKKQAAVCDRGGKTGTVRLALPPSQRRYVFLLRELLGEGKLVRQQVLSALAWLPVLRPAQAAAHRNELAHERAAHPLSP